MKINSIKKQKNGNYKIIGDNDYIILADELILKYNILFKKEISDREKEQYLAENYKFECLNKALKYIKTKMRSKKEINKFLAKFELDKQSKLFIIDKLEKSNLINDEKYAEAYVYDHFNLTHDGPYKIKKDLLALGILEDIIDLEISKIPISEISHKLEKMIIKKINNNTKYTKGQLIRKIEYEFYNMGYNQEMIDEIFENHFVALNEDLLIEKDYQKIYSKYKNKYDSNKLKTVVKQKLYQKGYSVDTINNFVNKKL